MLFLLGILMCGSAVMIAWHYWEAFVEDGPRWFVRWTFQGLIAPCLLWLAINAGLFWTFGPFMPEVSMAKSALRPWVPLLLHYASEDKRINDGWPAYVAALKQHGKKYQAFIYPNTQHGFHNDTTPRYDAAAAKLSWQRTLDFVRANLRA